MKNDLNDTLIDYGVCFLFFCKRNSKRA